MGRFPLHTQQSLPEDWDDAGKMSCSSFPFHVVLLNFFGSAVLLIFLHGLLRSPELFLFMGSCLIIDLHFVGEQRLGSPTSPSW